MKYAYLAAAFAALTLSGPAAAGDAAVACAQAYLAHSGFDPGPVDGAMGRRTGAAAADFATARGVDLPALTTETAPAWCALAEADADYVALRDFDYDGAGVLPADVVFKALRAPEAQRARACGFVSSAAVKQLDRVEPITRISGFNSRMDNWASVEHAREAETFVGEFAKVSVAAFVNGDDATKTGLVELLAKWARAGAFLKTEACVTRNGNLITSGACAEWRQPDGQDLSAMKDASHSTFLMAALVRSYAALLADHATDDLAADHEAIRAWIDDGFAHRLKRPSSVYFGLNMGWYWPAINLDLMAGRTAAARAKLDKVQREIDRLLLADGSIRDRTTRGDRALWYHYTSIGEVVMSLEMMRAAGMTIRPSIEAKLHKAVDLFVRTVDDFTVIDPWARKRHNSSYRNETQDWSRDWWPNNDFAGSWLHVYPYRYPDHPNAAALRAKVAWDAQSARKDIDYGVGVGCIYNLAAGIVE